MESPGRLTPASCLRRWGWLPRPSIISSGTKTSLPSASRSEFQAGAGDATGLAPKSCPDRLDSDDPQCSLPRTRWNRDCAGRLVLLRLETPGAQIRAATRIVHSGAFGLVVVDLADSLPPESSAPQSVHKSGTDSAAAPGRTSSPRTRNLMPLQGASRDSLLCRGLPDSHTNTEPPSSC